jgi:hypothetical protein
MSGFSAAWLGLREPADHSARSVDLSKAVVNYLGRAITDISCRRPLRIVDLATGTGSNPRFLARFLPAWQEWTVLDADAALLSELPTRMAAWASRTGWSCVHVSEGVVAAASGVEVRVLPRTADLSKFPIAALQARPALVTASALLDLVSEEWLGALVDACRSADAAALFTLSYDGRISITPGMPEDELVIDLVNHHQLGNKGFGLALGPGAVARAAAQFAAADYEVLRERSDWTLGPEDRALQEELIIGWSGAAREMRPAQAERIELWEAQRRRSAAAGDLTITVGHEDIAAWPRGPAALTTT